MPSRHPVPTLVFGPIEDVPLSALVPRDFIGKRPGATFEWFTDERALRQRVFDRARHEKLRMGTTCVFTSKKTSRDAPSARAHTGWNE